MKLWDPLFLHAKTISIVGYIISNPAPSRYVLPNLVIPLDRALSSVDFHGPFTLLTECLPLSLRGNIHSRWHMFTDGYI